MPSKVAFLHSEDTAFMSSLCLKDIYFFPEQWCIPIPHSPLGPLVLLVFIFDALFPMDSEGVGAGV